MRNGSIDTYISIWMRNGTIDTYISMDEEWDNRYLHKYG